MTKKDNIIFFPVERVTNLTPPRTIDEVHDRLNDVHLYHVQEAIDATIPKLFEMLEAAGFYPNEDADNIESCLKASALVCESIRSFLCTNYNIEHPLQHVSENLFYIDGDGDVQVFDNVKITLSKESDKNESEMEQ